MINLYSNLIPQLQVKVNISGVNGLLLTMTTLAIIKSNEDSMI